MISSEASRIITAKIVQLRQIIGTNGILRYEKIMILGCDVEFLYRCRQSWSTTEASVASSRT